MEESPRGKRSSVTIDPERLDQGKQTKVTLFGEWEEPHVFPLARGVCWANKRVVEMRNSGDVPGVAGLGARAEAAGIVDKIGDDNLDELEGEPGNRGRGY